MALFLTGSRRREHALPPCQAEHRLEDITKYQGSARRNRILFDNFVYTIRTF
jgi:hypothetical protein